MRDVYVVGSYTTTFKKHPGLSFGDLMNQMGKGILLNDRGQALVDAAYRCLGYGTNAGGSWTR